MDSQLGSHPLCTQRRWMGATPTVLPVSSQKRETTPMAKRSTKQQRGGQNSHGDCRTPRPLRAVLETAKGLCVFVCVCGWVWVWVWVWCVCGVCVCGVCVFSNTPFCVCSKRFVPASVAFATVPWWNRLASLTTVSLENVAVASFAQLGENTK